MDTYTVMYYYDLNIDVLVHENICSRISWTTHNHRLHCWWITSWIQNISLRFSSGRKFCFHCSWPALEEGFFFEDSRVRVTCKFCNSEGLCFFDDVRVVPSRLSFIFVRFSVRSRSTVIEGPLGSLDIIVLGGGLIKPMDVEMNRLVSLENLSSPRQRVEDVLESTIV